MSKQKRKNKLKKVVMFIICAFSIFLSTFSIFSTYQLHQTASMIYNHPYTVSNESRAMRSRLLDMKSFLLNIVAEPSWEIDNVQQLLNGRYNMQYNAIEIITNQYLGPSEDTIQLLNAMNDLKNTQNDSLPIILPMTKEETALYVEQNIYPKYDAVDAALTKIIAFADQKIKGLEKHSANTATTAILSSLLLTIFLPAYFLFAFWRERKNIHEIQYREHLFDILSSNVDEVFLIYNKEHAELELSLIHIYNSDNEGHIFIKITNDTNTGKTVSLKQGDAFAQGIFVQYGITVDDDATGIRNGGFGSTGK